MPAERLRAWQAGARAPVLAAIIASAAMGMIAVVGSLSWVDVGTSAGIEGAACVTVMAETVFYLGRSTLLATLWSLVD